MTTESGTRLVLALGLAACLTAPAAGQEVLERADALARAGRADEARGELSTWWDAERESASRADVQRAIWLRALLTVDPAQAALDYERLVVEFPGGSFADRALLRLAQAAEASGDPWEAAARYRVLLRDYPGSPLRLESQSWLDENAERLARLPSPSERPEPSVPQPTTDTVRAPAGDTSVAAPPAGDSGAVVPVPISPPPDEPAELPGKHDVVGAPDSAMTAPDSSAVGAAGPEGAAAVPTTEPTGDFTVQLGAFSSEAGARLLADRARRAGLEPRLVTTLGSPLIRVRVGRYGDAEPATRLFDRVVTLGFEAMVLADAATELSAGGGEPPAGGGGAP